MTKEEALYESMFKDIPRDLGDRIIYILGRRATNKPFNDDVQKTAKKITQIKWKSCEFTMYAIPKPSPRPRANARAGYIHMYVPGAADRGAAFEKYYNQSNLPYIDTPCKLNIDIYEKTPSSFSTKNAVLAELGVIRPWRRTGDFDNFAKSVADMMQHGMLDDDALVIESQIRLFYSILPRYSVEVKYMVKHPDAILFPRDYAERKKVKKS